MSIHVYTCLYIKYEHTRTHRQTPCRMFLEIPGKTCFGLFLDLFLICIVDGSIFRIVESCRTDLHWYAVRSRLPPRLERFLQNQAGPAGRFVVRVLHLFLCSTMHTTKYSWVNFTHVEWHRYTSHTCTYIVSLYIYIYIHAYWYIYIYTHIPPGAPNAF